MIESGQDPQPLALWLFNWFKDKKNKQKVFALEAVISLIILSLAVGVRAADTEAVMVKDMFPGSLSSRPYLTSVGSTLFFQATNATAGYELFKSDGTGSGTVMVKDINVGLGSSSAANLTAVGSTLYFQANDGVNGFEL